jgi:hypothetical protein
MSVFHGLFAGKTWQPAIIGMAGALLDGVGVGDGTGDGFTLGVGVGLAVN